ncbi:MAG: 16S rRNA (guanine(527)-N(7))-methyltransferase RsmG [Chloroflexi bacterium]|nr:16S rRNA (guanine(527)-N(7))-methyltransferase RsmG [Chloroflexota bacterium]
MQNWNERATIEYGIDISPFQAEQFDIYLRELLEWNQKFNLTAIRDVEGIKLKHFLDSLSIVKAFPTGFIPQSIIDIGTGAGLPGIPLKIIFPETKLTLVESVKKKARFCDHIVEVLALNDVIVSSARAEEIGQDPPHREGYQLALARAVARMPVLVEYLLPLVKVGGLVVMQKSASAHEEAEASRNAIRLMGGKLVSILPVKLPEVEDERYLVTLEKIKPTPAEFPRRVGIPTKLPIQN